MYPILYKDGLFIVYTHDFFTVVGLVVGLCLYYSELRKRNMLDHKIFWISIAAIFGGGIGCRLVTVWEHPAYYSTLGQVPLSYFIAHSGKGIIGALAGGYGAIVLSKKAFHYTESTGDCYAIAIAVGMAIGRVGCFLSELPLGKPTDLPWAISVSPEVIRNFPDCSYCLGKMHPSMIYEIIFHLLAVVLIMRYRHLVIVKGDTLKLYLLASAIFRFLVEFTRANSEQLWGLTGPQVVLIPLTTSLCAIMDETTSPTKFNIQLKGGEQGQSACQSHRKPIQKCSRKPNVVVLLRSINDRLWLKRRGVSMAS
jgi:prolipoprotein diacylglyceryltransferase